MSLPAGGRRTDRDWGESREDEKRANRSEVTICRWTFSACMSWCLLACARVGSCRKDPAEKEQDVLSSTVAWHQDAGTRAHAGAHTHQRLRGQRLSTGAHTQTHWQLSDSLEQTHTLTHIYSIISHICTFKTDQSRRVHTGARTHTDTHSSPHNRPFQHQDHS